MVKRLIRKNIKLFILLISLSFCVINNVNALEITNVLYDENIIVEGNANDTVQIVLFDSYNNPVYMTTSTPNNNTFFVKFPKINTLGNGEYKVKVASYDGENVATKKLIITNISNPKTYDNILILLFIGLISLIGILYSSKYLKNKC